MLFDLSTITYKWDHTVKGTCGDQRDLDLFIVVFNLFMDITTVVLPLPVLWGLQMARSKKLVLSGMFSMGIVICVITLVRIKVAINIKSQDPQVQWALIAFLVDLEVLLGIINACLPVMKPVSNKLGGANLFASLSRRTSSWTAGKRSHASRSNHNRIPSLEKNDSCDRRKHVVLEGSYQIVSQVSLPKGVGHGLKAAYLARPNSTVIEAVRDPEHTTSKALSTFLKGPSSTLIVVKIDSASEPDIAAAIEQLQSAHKITALDVVIANTGICTELPTVAQVKFASIQEHILVNAFGPLVLFQAVLPLLQKAQSPKFVAVSSAAASCEYRRL
ncbi:hypothetical protein OEA41_008565 [Lepraria neglecta]|uniref:Rhodopsin domain-containing protein n=1 Tax=Lepraria neglecta TaxID=209136 RepID=A0AAE0DNY1_9LECA|nr:hypothetical protein OEA41_008565 [Lepraria neglecta]